MAAPLMSNARMTGRCLTDMTDSGRCEIGMIIAVTRDLRVARRNRFRQRVPGTVVTGWAYKATLAAGASFLGIME